MSLTLVCLKDFILTLLQNLWLATPIIDCDSFFQAISDLHLQGTFLLFLQNLKLTSSLLSLSSYHS